MNEALNFLCQPKAMKHAVIMQERERAAAVARQVFWDDPKLRDKIQKKITGCAPPPERRKTPRRTGRMNLV